MRPTIEVETRQPSRWSKTTSLSLPQRGYWPRRCRTRSAVQVGCRPRCGRCERDSSCVRRGSRFPAAIAPDGCHREAHSRRDPTPFSTRPGHCYCMKRLSTPRKLCVFRHDPSICALSPNKPLLLNSRSLPFTAILPFGQLLNGLHHLLQSAVLLRHTTTPPLHSIQIA